MEIYKYGKIVSIGKTYLILETNNIGNIVYVPNIEVFTPEERRKIFIYKYTTEFTTAIYGFATFKERLMFEDLISINGIGPKTAIGLLKEGKEMLMNLLAKGDVEGLSSFPYLGVKTANQIVFELSGKYKNMMAKSKGESLYLPVEAKKSLKTLGFNSKQIEYAIHAIKPESNIEKLIEEAIKVISNTKFA